MDSGCTYTSNDFGMYYTYVRLRWGRSIERSFDVELFMDRRRDCVLESGTIADLHARVTIHGYRNHLFAFRDPDRIPLCCKSGVGTSLGGCGAALTGSELEFEVESSRLQEQDSKPTGKISQRSYHFIFG
ncbi:hypothetical protein PENTCL1PPCAC_4666, partial [Pristionchus entomophagus]